MIIFVILSANLLIKVKNNKKIKKLLINGSKEEEE